jgi:DNA-binding transcriptional ArsR family regulator
MTDNENKELKMQELREKARDLGLPILKHETKEEILKRLEDSEPKPEPKPLPDNLEDLKAALKPLLDKGVEFSIDAVSLSWIARFRGAENSGSLTMSVKKIVQQVSEVARGARKPARIKNGDFEGAFA